MEAQAGWATSLASLYQRVFGALLRRRDLRDVLHGRWLGHPVHAAVTDLPIGALVVVVVLDVAGQPTAADIALVIAVVSMIAAIATGAADFLEMEGRVRARTSLHATVMLVGLAAVVASLIIRAAGPEDRVVPVWLSSIGLLIVAAGAYVGGDLVFVLGNAVSRHAFRATHNRWMRLELESIDLSSLDEGVPIKARTATHDVVVLVRLGDVVHALDEACAHAGAPLSRGGVEDGCLVCPLHGTRFRLADGRVTQGPSVYDQPTYEVRLAMGGGYEVRRPKA